MSDPNHSTYFADNGSRNRPASGTIRLRESSALIEAAHHRSGWAFVKSALSKIEDSRGVLLDDFVDKSFGWAPTTTPINVPWIGIFHKPYGWPSWLGDSAGINTTPKLLASGLFNKSRPYLKAAVTLSTSLAADLSRDLDIPVLAAKHPTPLAVKRFSPRRFLTRKSNLILQIGYVLRNQRAIYQLGDIEGFRRVRLLIPKPSVKVYESQVTKNWETCQGRVEYSGVREIRRISNDAYDSVLTHSAVFLEMIASSATNTVLECRARATPLVVNRLPALEEYLGRGYPLFYDSFEEARALISRPTLLDGHRYLKNLESQHLSVDKFVSRIAQIAGEIDRC